MRLAADPPQLVERDAGDAAARRVARLGHLDAGPGAVEPVRLVGAIALPGLELGFELRPPGGPGALDLIARDEALVGELLAVDLERPRVLGDLAVHDRLGEGRLVAFVMAVPAIAEHVDDHRLVESLPELDRDLGGIDDGLRIVAIAVEDRRLDHLGDVRGVR